MLVSLTPVDEIFIELSSSARTREAYILREQLHLIGTEPRISMNLFDDITIPPKAQIWDKGFHEISLAIPKAAAAAKPPISSVCKPLRRGAVPVKWPF
jgi:hypothetical protein